MPSREQWVPIKFVRGVDTEADDKALEPGTPTEILNGVLTKRTTIEKRFGTRRLSRRRVTSDMTYQAVSGCLGLASRADESDLTMLATTDEVLSYDDTEDAWVDRGDWANLSNEVTALPRGSNERWDGSNAVVENVRLFAWEDARDGVHAQMFADDTGNAYGPDFRVGGSLGRQPRTLSVGGRFQVYFTSGTELHVAVLDASRPTSRNFSSVQLHTGLSSSIAVGACPYDVCTHPSWGRAALAASVSGSTYVAWIRANGVIGTSGSSQPLPDPVSALRSDAGPALAASQDGIALALGFKGTNNTGKGYFCRVYDASTLQPLISSITLDSDASITANGETVRRHTVCFASGTTEVAGGFTAYTVHGFVELSAALASDRIVRRSSGYTIAPTTIAGVNVMRHSSLASKAFNYGPHSYVWLHRPSTFQATDFLVREDGVHVAKSRPSLSVADVSGTLSEIDVVGNVAHRAATTRDLLPVPEGSGSQFGGRHIRHLATTFQDPSSWRPIDVGGVLVMPGGWLGTYDGASTCELGFSELVDFITATPGSASLGRNGIQVMGGYPGLTAATSASYLYEVLPERFDAYGNRYLGGCLASVQVYLSASSTQVQNICSLSWPSMVHTMADGTRNPYDRFAVYRTGANLTTRQRVDDPAFPVLNTTASDYVTFSDTFSEVTRAAGEVSYTMVEPTNVMPTSARLLAQAGDRVYAAGLEDEPNLVLASKLRLGGAISFADGAEFSVDPDGGPITAIGGLDKDLAIFKRSKVFGAGTDNMPENTLDSGNPWPVPTAITSDVGAREPAVVFPIAGRTEQGLAFESERGIRLLERGAQVKDIGWPARGYDDLDIVAGLAPRLSEEARFYTSEGTTIVFNTRFDQWSTAEAQPSVGATLWNGRPVWASDDGFCYVEERDTYRDGDQTYPLRITLGWMAFEGLQGLQRVNSVCLLGDLKSQHTLRLEVATDYRDNWVVLREIATSGSMDSYGYGGPPAYGSGSYGGRETVYQHEFALPSGVTRCQAVRFRISDVAQSGSAAGYSLAEMKLGVSIEKSRPSLPARKRR